MTTIELKCRHCACIEELDFDDGQFVESYACPNCKSHGMSVQVYEGKDRNLRALFIDQEVRIQKLETLIRRLLESHAFLGFDVDDLPDETHET